MAHGQEGVAHPPWPETNLSQYLSQLNPWNIFEKYVYKSQNFGIPPQMSIVEQARAEK